MAKKATLKDPATGVALYPYTLVDSVQDETGALLKALILMKDNTSEFTPSADYQPATKKYVDDNAGGKADDVLSSTSTNPIQNKVVTEALNGKQPAGSYAPGGFGLGDFCTIIADGTDIVANASGMRSGFYMGTGLTNGAPSSGSLNGHYYLHLCRDSNYHSFIAIPFDSVEVYVGVINNGTWSGWSQVFPAVFS